MEDEDIGFAGGRSEPGPHLPPMSRTIFDDDGHPHLVSVETATSNPPPSNGKIVSIEEKAIQLSEIARHLDGDSEFFD